MLSDPDFHCFVAELDGALVGQVTVVPAAKAARPVEDPALAHLRNLYVDRTPWGSGPAAALMAAAGPFFDPDPGPADGRVPARVECAAAWAGPRSTWRC